MNGTRSYPCRRSNRSGTDQKRAEAAEIATLHKFDAIEAHQLAREKLVFLTDQMKSDD